ncbi:MAG: RDD family protein [Bacteroidota bacterium]
MEQLIEIKTTQNVNIEYELASLRERIFAFVIDALIVAVGYTIIYLIIAPLLLDLILNYPMLGVVIGLLPFFLFLIYHFSMEYFNDGQTIGKSALNIKVVRLDGRQPHATDNLIRAFFLIVEAIFSSGVLAAIIISTTAKRQRLGDLTANTTVIRTRNHQNFRLQDILRIGTTEDYEATYPGVKQFSEEDMLLIKKVMDRYQRHFNPAHQQAINQLTDSVSKALEIPAPKDNRLEFLRTVLRDYIVLTR